MAFIASLLSVIASTLSYKIDRDTSDTEVVQYYLSTESNAMDNRGNRKQLSDSERTNIINNRGRTMHLSESIAEVFGITPTNIEIGYTRITKHGLITHIVHYADINDLEEMQHELQQLPGDHPQIISASYFTEKLFLSLQTDITEVMRNHFNLNHDFDVEYTTRSGVWKKSEIIDRNIIIKRMATHISLGTWKNDEQEEREDDDVYLKRIYKHFCDTHCSNSVNELRSFCNQSIGPVTESVGDDCKEEELSTTQDRSDSYSTYN
eukprot:647483_1